ncbi:MAG: VWA domain-containing protein [Pyrinomonadaceae bacterium]
MQLGKSPYLSRTSIFFSLALALTFLCAAVVMSQTQYPTERPRRALPEQDQPEEVVRVDTDLVSVDVMVLDQQGKAIRTLGKQDFKLYEDGIEQPIALFNLERREGSPRPVAVVFALDLSGSMSPEEMERVQEAMRQFSQRLANHPSTYALMTFGMRVKLLQKFTNDPQKLERAFERLSREPSGLSTHTYDAVDDAIRQLVRHAPPTLQHQITKKAVVVITDGFPVGDTVSAATVIERANTANVSVYVVTLPSFSRMATRAELTPLPTPLDVSGLTEKTGGISVYATEQDLGPLFRSLASEVTSAYVLGFYPGEDKRNDGNFHSVKIEGPPGLLLRQSRPGYKAARK